MDTQAEELFVAVAALISSALFEPLAGVLGALAFGVGIYTARRYARTLRREERSELPARAHPRLAPEVPARLRRLAAQGDVMADSYLRILAHLFPEDVTPAA